MADHDESTLSARESLALIERERQQVARSLVVDPVALYTTWGLAWAIGFTTLLLTEDDAWWVGAGILWALIGAALATGSASVFAGVPGNLPGAGARRWWRLPARRGVLRVPASRAGRVTTLPDLDPVIHAQARLRVVVSLTALPRGDRISFPRLQELLGMTAGNLSTHLRKLEDAGYVEVTKTHERRTPVTYLALTPPGRRAFEDYSIALRGYLLHTTTDED